MKGQRKSSSDWLHLMTASQVCGIPSLVLGFWFWSFSPLTGLESSPFLTTHQAALETRTRMAEQPEG